MRARPGGPGAFGVHGGMTPPMSKFFVELSAAVTPAAVMFPGFSTPRLTIWSSVHSPSHCANVVGPCWRRSAYLSPPPRLYATPSSCLNCLTTGFGELNGRKFENVSRRSWIASPPAFGLLNGLTELAAITRTVELPLAD